MMNSEELIVELAASAAPVRPLPSPIERLARWLPIAGLFAVLGVAVFGLRPNLVASVATPAFWVDALMTSTVVLAGGWAALTLAVPGAETRGLLRAIAAAALGLWGMTLGAEAWPDGLVQTDRHWMACFARVALVGLVPAAALTVMVRRAAPLRPRLAAALAVAAAAAAGAAAVLLVCPIPLAGHRLAGHVTPILVLALCAATVGPRLLLGAPQRVGSDYDRRDAGGPTRT